MPRHQRSRTMGTAIVGLTLAFVGVAASPAFAATGLAPAPSIDASGHSFYLDGDTTVATVTGLQANTDYYVGQCSNTAYLFGIPACAGFQSVTTDASGTLTASVALVARGANTHASAPGQPSTVDCTANDACAIKVATHGSNKRVVDQSSAFRVDE